MNSYELVKSLYKDDYGKPFEMTPGQIKIFDSIFKRKHPRNHIMTYTQYGKSDIISMAILTRASTSPEKWPVVAPTGKKAKIIMGYVIKHIFENDYTRTKFQISKSESAERIRRERSKQRMTFGISGGRIGEIFILSADARRKGLDAGDSLMGFGAPNLIEDESALIPNNIHSKAMRMLGGHKDNFLAKIGNPFRRNHFLKSYQSDNYNKAIVDYQQGIKEGRITKEFVEEMRDEAFFDVLYECKFPEQTEIDEQGWSLLLTDKDIEKAMKRSFEPKGKKKLGVDVARGGNFNAYVVRDDKTMRLKHKDRDPDTMGTVGKIIRFKKEENITSEDTAVDDVGIGGGITDRLREQGHNIVAFKEGGRARNPEKFINAKAEAYWEMRKWILNGGALERNDDWFQLTQIRFKEDSSSRLKLESKQDLIRRGIESPDSADAAMLTFAQPEFEWKISLA